MSLKKEWQHWSIPHSWQNIYETEKVPIPCIIFCFKGILVVQGWPYFSHINIDYHHKTG